MSSPGLERVRATVRATAYRTQTGNSVFEMLIIWPIIVLLLALGVTALVLWIGYRLIVSAVRAGVLEANAEQARRDQGLPPTRWSILAARPEPGAPPAP